MTTTDQGPARRYMPLMSAFTVAGGALTHLASRRVRPAAGPLEFAESALATFFLARVVAQEKIGSVVREPFVEPAPGTDPLDARGDTKRPAGEGIRYGVGELVTCTRCLGPWAAALVTFANAFAPSHGRVATRVLALGGANILAQAAQAAMSETANRAAER